jgi:hypothetical protein
MGQSNEAAGIHQVDCRLYGGVAASRACCRRAKETHWIVGPILQNAIAKPKLKSRHFRGSFGGSDGPAEAMRRLMCAGPAEMLPAGVLAKELLAWNPDVVLSRTTAVTAALLQQTRSVPIVFVIVSDPVGYCFVESMARPGRNVTGFTNVEASLAGKWLEMLKEISPGISRAAVIFDPKTSPGGGAFTCA